MSLIISIKCPNCNKYYELASELNGKMISMNEFYQNGFHVNTPEIELDGDIENLEDLDDINSELKSIRIDCENCGEYIVLEEWR